MQGDEEGVREIIRGVNGESPDLSSNGVLLRALERYKSTIALEGFF